MVCGTNRWGWSARHFRIELNRNRPIRIESWSFVGPWFWAILWKLPRRVEAQVVRLEVEFDSTKPGPPRLTSWVLPVHREMVDSCSEGTLMIMWLMGQHVQCDRKDGDASMQWEVTGSWLVLCLTSSLVIWAVYGICKIRHRHHCSKALICWLDSFTILHISAPFRRIGSMYALYSRTLVCRLMEECHMLRSSAFIHEHVNSILQRILHLPPSSCVNTWANVDKKSRLHQTRDRGQIP